MNNYRSGFKNFIKYQKRQILEKMLSKHPTRRHVVRCWKSYSSWML